MAALPSVSIVISTYARVKWLEEAVYSAILQNYPDYEILVLNDCPRQTLTCDAPGIRILNFTTSFPTFGEKRNASVQHATGQWIAFLDDDDVILPHHLLRTSIAVDAGKHTAAATHGFFFDGDRGERVGSSVMDLIAERQHIITSGGFSALDNGDEHALIRNLEKLEPLNRVDTKHKPTYVYMWGNGVHHLSGGGDPFGGIGFKKEANERMDRGEEPTGTITLKPHWRRNYRAMCQSIMDQAS